MSEPCDTLTADLVEALAKEPVDQRLVQALAERGADLNHRNSYGDCLLCSIISNVGFGADSRAVKLLLDLGADPDNGEEMEGNRPLTSAMYAANPDIVRWLIAAGASPNYLIDYHDSLLDMAKIDRSYHADHSNGDAHDGRMVAFYDEIIPLLEASGARSSREFVASKPEIFVWVSRFGLWTARGTLCPQLMGAELAHDFEQWCQRGQDVWPEGLMPEEFDRHQHNLEGLILASRVHAIMPADIKVKFQCLDPVGCWWFQRFFQELELEHGRPSGPLRLPYEFSEDCDARWDVVESAVFDVETNLLNRTPRLLLNFRPLPFTFDRDSLCVLLSGTGGELEVWDPTFQAMSPVGQPASGGTGVARVVKDADMIMIQHADISWRGTLRSIRRSLEKTTPARHHILKSHEWALWLARLRKGLHNEKSFWWV